MAADAATEFPRQPLGQGDVLQLQWQLKHAVDAGMFASAGMLGRLLLGAQRRVDSLPQLGVGSVSETLVLLGDTSYGESEHLSALNNYTTALEAVVAVTGDQPASVMEASLVARIRTKMAFCAARMKEHDRAVELLRQIPLRYRSSAASVQLATSICKTAAGAELRQRAVRDALRQAPFALELLPLAQAAGLSQEDVHATLAACSVPAPALPAGSALFPLAGIAWGTTASEGEHEDAAVDVDGAPPAATDAAAARAGGAGPAQGLRSERKADAPERESKDDGVHGSDQGADAAGAAPVRRERIRPSVLRCLSLISKAQTASARAEFSVAEAAFRSLLFALPGVRFLQAGLAHCLLRRGHPGPAKELLLQAHAEEPVCVDGTALLAQLLGQTGSLQELASLANALLSVAASSPQFARPEPWLAAGILQVTSRSNVQSGLRLVDHAIRLAPDDDYAHYIRGSLALAVGDSRRAEHAFKRSLRLRADIGTYTGLVMALVNLRSFREAFGIAREAARHMPRSVEPVALLGYVLSSTHSGRPVAVRALRKALSLDPTNADAAIWLADALVKLGKSSDACDMLSTTVTHISTARLHEKLGCVLATIGRHREAIAAFHRALNLDPNSAPALEGLDQVERALRGVEPRGEAGSGAGLGMQLEGDPEAFLGRDFSDRSSSRGSYESSVDE